MKCTMEYPKGHSSWIEPFAERNNQ